MKTIVLIIPYFGDFPNYFSLWLHSAEKNPTIDFLIFTDNDILFTHEKNIHFIKCSFEEFKKKLQAVIEFPICLNTPYKLCDYKPVYGYALQNYISEYDFWGYCDVDLIFGNIRKFISDNILQGYKRIYTRGHLSIFKNDNIGNLLWKKKHNQYAYDYKEAFSVPYICHFDEWGGISTYLDNIGFRQFDRIDFADVNCKKFNFEMVERQVGDIPQIYEWSDGTLCCIMVEEDKLVPMEILYVHLQKRKMEIDNTMDGFHYLIIPNKFINYEKLNVKKVRNFSRKKVYLEYTITRWKEILLKIKTGAIGQRLYRYRKKRRIKCNEM